MAPFGHRMLYAAVIEDMVFNTDTFDKNWNFLIVYFTGDDFSEVCLHKFDGTCVRDLVLRYYEWICS